MADFRRRSTMQPAADPHGNRFGSGIPMPSTIKKHAPTHGRMSMSGPALRAPFAIPQVPGTIQRNNMMRSQNTNPLLMSVSKQGLGRTPMNSARRGSMWMGGGQPSAPSGSQTLRDPRPIRDGAFQQKIRRDIVNFLQKTGFDIPNNVLRNITGADFGAIFKHLVSCLDPQWPFNPDQRWEEQFFAPLRALKYPYIGAIDSKMLPTPAAQHSWPTLLAMLHWLTEMGKARLSYMESQDPTLQDPEYVPDEFSDNNHHQALAMEYYSAAYQFFLDGQDVYPEQDAALEERYARKDERVVADLEEKREKLKEVKSELKKLLKTPAPIERLKNHNGLLKHDKPKFEEVIRLLEDRKQRLMDTIAREKAEMAVLVANLDKLKVEQDRLAEIVKVQNLSPEEVIRMNTEHESLSRDLENLKHKITETNKTVMKLEVSLTKKVTDAEEAVDVYTNLLASLNLFPPLPPPLADINLALELNTAAPNPQDMLSGAGIRETIKPSLAIVAELKRTERADIESERIKVDNELDQLITECENMDQEVVEVMNKVNALNDQADELREVVQQEAMVSNAEATRLERELAQARTSAMANGVGVKTRLQAVHIAYREQVDKVDRLRDETVRAIIKNSSDIVTFKEEVSKQLKYLKDFAEAN